MNRAIQIRKEQDEFLLKAVKTKLVKFTGQSPNETTKIARDLIKLVRSSLVAELKDAQSDAEYVLENEASIEWLDAPKEPTTGWWVDMLDELLDELPE
jgi:hypothetical protein